MKLKFLFFTLFVFSLSIISSAQYKIVFGNIYDAHSYEPIPLASLSFKNTTIGGITDSSGRFSFVFEKSWPSDTLVVTCVGYQPLLIFLPPNKDTLELASVMQRGVINESALVSTKISKGLFLWKKIVEHKDQNNIFVRFDNFSYNLYNKLEIDLKNVPLDMLLKIKPLRPFGNLLSGNIDTLNGHKFLPTYLTESISKYYFSRNPTKRREIMEAVNTNGVKNESIIKFLGGMNQVVNVYNNFIPVFDKQFISPLSNAGKNYYVYRVTDTLINGKNRYYHLWFYPKHKGESVFSGDCWVHFGTYAIQKMSLRLDRSSNINFLDQLSLIQEFKMLNDSTWFLEKDKFVADVTPIGKESLGFIGRKTTNYKNIVLNDTLVEAELAKNKLQEEIITPPNIDTMQKGYWKDNRFEPLNKNEQAIITMIDTLTSDPKFMQFTRVINLIGTGYWNIGKLQLGPWYNAFTYNGWEGYRMRFDLGTNHKLSKKIYAHGYLAYGFGDRKFRGMGEILYLPIKHPRTYIYVSYTNDLDFGQNYYGEITSDNIFTLAIRKPYAPLKYMLVKEKRLEVFHEFNSGFSIKGGMLNKDFTPLQNLPLKSDFPVIKSNTEPLVTTEAFVRLRFAYLEKFVENNFFRISMGSPYPIVELYASQGVKGIAKSSYNYTKLSGSISDNVKIPPLGKFYFNLFGGKTFGTLPYVLLDIAPGNELYYYNTYAFNLMNRYEYVHDKYLGLVLEHNIGSGIFRFFGPTRKLKFRQVWTLKTLWGGVSQANRELNFSPTSNFQSLGEQTYMEIGTGVTNIFRVFRIDCVWRVLPASLDSKTAHSFGVFGSFQVNF